MSLQTEIQTTIPDYRGAEQRANDRLRGINIRASRELLRVARSVVHVVTGRLQRGLVAEGPFNISTGVLEAQISAPSVPYAAVEASRGDEHDYPTRTLKEGQGIIDRAAEDMEAALIDVMEGR